MSKSNGFRPRVVSGCLEALFVGALLTLPTAWAAGKCELPRLCAEAGRSQDLQLSLSSQLGGVDSFKRKSVGPGAGDDRDAPAAGLSKPDTLTLRSLFDATAATHPSLLAVRTQATAAAQDIVVAERQRWPTLSIVAETDTGTTRSPNSRYLRIDQVLWDAGRNSARIAEAEGQADVSMTQVYLQEEQLFINVVNAWQNLMMSNERRKAAMETQRLLLNYRDKMQRRVESQASSVIEMELVNSRLLQTNVELTMAETTLRTAIARLAQLTGVVDIESRLDAIEEIPEVESQRDLVARMQQVDLDVVASQHSMVVKARGDLAVMKSRLSAKEAERWPQVYARVDQPLGATSYYTDTSATAFVGVRYTPGAGFSQFAEGKALATRMASLEHTIQAAMREVRESLENDRDEFSNAILRISALEKAVDGSDKVMESYLRQFQAGRKSWLDLLNAVRELAQNKYSLADARAAMVAARHRLEIRMGYNPL